MHSNIVHVVGDPELPNVFTVHKKVGHNRFTHDILLTVMRNRWVFTLSMAFVS
jgi:hypothetical protein